MKRYIIPTAVFMVVALIGVVAIAATGTYWGSGVDNAGNNMVYRDNTYSPTRGESIWDSCPQLSALDPIAGRIFMEDFSATFDSTYTWSIEADDVGGTHAALDSIGGVYQIVTDGDDNDEAYIYQPVETFKVKTDKPFWIEARVMITEDSDSTYAGNYIFGVIDSAVGSGNVLVDDGAGPPANYSGAVFYKADIGTSWCTETSSTTTQETNANVVTRTSGTYHKLGIVYDGNGYIRFYVDGALEATHSTTLPATEMKIVAGVKTGAAVAATLGIDYIKAVQIR